MTKDDCVTLNNTVFIVGFQVSVTMTVMTVIKMICIPGQRYLYTSFMKENANMFVLLGLLLPWSVPVISGMEYLPITTSIQSSTSLLTCALRRSIVLQFFWSARKCL